MLNQNSAPVHGKKICWVSFLILDRDLHKTSQIEIMKSLAERGHETSLFGICSKEKFRSSMKNVRLISVPMRYISLLTALMYTFLLSIYLPFYLAFSKTDFVIVEPQSPVFLSLVPIRLFPKSIRPKIVLDIRSTPVDVAHSDTLFFDIGVSVGKKLSDGITIITPMMRTEVCNKFRIDQATVGIWSSGVSTSIFSPEKYDPVSLRKAFGLLDKFVIFYHGSIGRSYQYAQARGIIESIRSIGLLKKRLSDVVLFILGDSRCFDVLKNVIVACDLEDRIILHDKVAYEEVPKYIAMCDVGLVPIPDLAIWRNQCPLKLLEYASMGKVIIATDIPAHRYVLGTCKSVFFIPSSSPEEIAKAISEVHDGFENFAAMTACGRAIVDEKYSWRQVAADFEKYLLQIEKNVR
jgi:glycosyltransferase involved in cell wall biosynthesis